MDPYATHLRALVAVVCGTRGPVLELGAGDYSTPVLHGLCAGLGRKLVTVDADPECLGRYRHLETLNHKLLSAGDWTLPTCDQLWSVVFVDHAPVERRGKEIERFRWQAEYLVIHDADDPETHGSVRLLASFPHVALYDEHRPHTAVASMLHGWKK